MDNELFSRQDLLIEIKGLRQKLSDIIQDKTDLQTVLDIVTEHADITSQELLVKLRTFNQQLVGLAQEKADLEISLETITQHADVFESELLVTKFIRT